MPHRAINISIEEFEKFLLVHRNLEATTARYYTTLLKRFLSDTGKPASRITNQDIGNFLLRIKKGRGSYRNYLAVIKIFFRDYLKQPEAVQGFKFPRKQVKPKILPSKAELKVFYDALPQTMYKAIFLLLASSGLRVGELLNSKIDMSNRMIIPHPSHTSSTKKSWISFYNDEAAALIDSILSESATESLMLKRWRVDTLNHVFKKVYVKTGIRVYPQLLRSVFAREMSLAGVPDRYIDAFCGRVPSSVLARHYTDYSPEVLREVYERANIRILE